MSAVREHAALQPSVKKASELKGHWKVFTDEEMGSEFHAMPWAEITLDATLDEVIKALMQPEFWNDSDEKDNSTRVSMIDRPKDGKVSYLRNVKTAFGPAKMRFRLWTTSWVEKTGTDGATVHMHGYDDGTLSIHVVSRFVLRQTSGGVMVRYEEMSSNTKASINLATTRIKKTHRRTLQLLAAQVIKVKMAKEMGELTNADGNLIQEGDAGDDSAEEAVLVQWQDLPLDKVRSEMLNVKTGIKVSDRQRGMKTYHNVWVANEAVDWLCENYHLPRSESVDLMRELQRRGYVVSRKAKKPTEFSDEHILFRWADPTVVPVRVLDRPIPRAARPSSPSLERADRGVPKLRVMLRRGSQSASQDKPHAFSTVIEEPSSPTEDAIFVDSSPPEGGTASLLQPIAELADDAGLPPSISVEDLSPRSALSASHRASPGTALPTKEAPVVPLIPVAGAAAMAPAVVMPALLPPPPLILEDESPALVSSKHMVAIASGVGVVLAYIGGYPLVPLILWLVTAGLVWKLQGDVKKVRQQLSSIQLAIHGVRQEQFDQGMRALSSVGAAAGVAPVHVVAATAAEPLHVSKRQLVLSAPAIVAPHATRSVLLINGERPNGGPQSFETEFASGSFLFKSRTNPMDPGVAPYFQGRNRMFELQCCFRLKQPIPDDHVVWVGAEIDGRLYMSTMIKFFVSTMLSLLRMFNTSLHHSFGTETERSHLMFPFHVFPDTIIVVPDGSPVPPLTLGNLPSVPKPPSVDIVPGRSYVMSFYSQYVDFENWTIQKLPGMNGVSLEKFWGKHPIHIVAYSIPKSAPLHDVSVRRLMMDIEIYNPLKTVK